MVTQDKAFSNRVK